MPSWNNQIQPVSADGSVYAYIVGLNPENNAKIVVGSLLGRINERLEAMAKAETRALKALRKYADDPNVDGPAGDYVGAGLRAGEIVVKGDAGALAACEIDRKSVV